MVLRERDHTTNQKRNHMAHFLIGAVFVCLGLWGLFSWWAVFGLVMRGLIPFLLLAIGLVAVLSGCYRIGSDEDEADETEDAVKERS